jgi:hypothetical protein
VVGEASIDTADHEMAHIGPSKRIQNSFDLADHPGPSSGWLSALHVATQETGRE